MSIIINPYIFSFPVIPPVSGFIGWYDATNPAGDGSRPADGTSVSSWADLSGNSRPLLQGTATNQPTYKTGVTPVGTPGILFDGVNDYLRIATQYSPGTTWTCFVVFKPTDSNWDGMIIASKTNNGGKDQVIRYQAPSSIMNFWNGPPTPYSYSITPSTNMFVDILRVPSSIQINGRVNGVQLSGGSKSTAASNWGQVGALGGDGPDGVIGGWWKGYVMEIIFYASSLSDANCQLLETYSKQKWGVII